MNNKNKEQLITNGVHQGLQHFIEYGDCNFKNKYDNPINVFFAVMNKEDVFNFIKKINTLMLEKYKNISYEELKINSVKKIVGYVDEKLVDSANDEVILSFISLEVVNIIKNIYSKLNIQTEIIFKELEIQVNNID